MSLNAATIELLIAAGKDMGDLIVVARAMERGDDARSVFSLIESLEDVETPPAAIGIAIFALAERINASQPQRPVRPPRDEHSEERDSNRSRRGMPDKEWRALRLRIFERDGHACTYCDSRIDLTCDHVVALVRGGTNDESNLTTACRPCNSSKGDKSLDEWRLQWA